MNALIGTGEIDGGQKRLSRKEALGPGKGLFAKWVMGLSAWENVGEGSRVQTCLKVRLFLEGLGTEWRQT